MRKLDTRRLGNELRRRRESYFQRGGKFAALSQEWLAKEAGMSQKKYSQIDLGKVRDPGIGDLAAIGAILGMSLAEMCSLLEKHLNPDVGLPDRDRSKARRRQAS